MLKISLCMIVRDEESFISKTIENLKDIVSEIIVVDTGSRDKSRECAKQYGAKVCNYIWCDDFSKVRNYSFGVASGDFIIWMDAGEFFNEINLKKLKEFVNKLNESIDVVCMKKIIEESNNGEIIKYIMTPRIVRKNSCIRWCGEAVEFLDVSGKMIKETSICINSQHKKLGSERFQIIKERKEANLPISSREILYYARLLMKNYKDREALLMYRELMRREDEEAYYYLETSLCLAEYYLKNNDISGFREYIFKSYEYGVPVAKAYFLMGEYFYKNCKYEEAIHWYLGAENLPLKILYDNEVDISYNSSLIYGQLSLCYSKIGDFNMAKFYNDKLAVYSENSPIVRYNRRAIEKTNYYIGENI